ncbi:MAG: polyprenyl synthetase family protein [Pseudomonadota bacterium]
MAMDDFQARLAQRAQQVGARLEEVLVSDPNADEVALPPQLIAAMRHGALNGGKRLRPILVVETASLFGGHEASALDVGVALECIHCYSLIHDDLPAMDDDDLRRGQPTVHVKFDEATAILAGDALLTLAFDVIASADGLDDAAKVRLTMALARAAGRGGMVGGQMLDLEHETKEADATTIRRIHAMKTGALIRFATQAGAICAGAPEADTVRMTRFGELLGLTFQLADDLLDVTASAEAMGKATGKDAKAGKKTQVAILGIDWARDQLGRYVSEANALLDTFGDEAEFLRQTARYIANRKR